MIINKGMYYYNDYLGVMRAVFTVPDKHGCIVVLDEQGCYKTVHVDNVHGCTQPEAHEGSPVEGSESYDDYIARLRPEENAAEFDRWITSLKEKREAEKREAQIERGQAWFKREFGS